MQICAARIISNFNSKIESQKVILRGTAICERNNIAFLNNFVKSDSDDTIPTGLFKLEKSTASLVIVSVDLFCVYMFFIFIVRLKYLEKLTVSDEQKKFIQIKDFTIYIPNLPIPADIYR